MLLQRVVLVIVVTLLVGGAAFAYSVSQEKQYESTMTIGIGRTLFSPEYSFFGLVEPDVEEETRIETEAKVIESVEVAEATARANPRFGYTAGQIAGLVTTEPLRGTMLVRIRARGSSPIAAFLLTNAYGNTYLNMRAQEDRRRTREAARALEARLAQLAPSRARGALGDNIRAQIGALTVFQRTGTGAYRVVERARPSASAVQPQTRRNVTFGLLFGVVVGIGLVALRRDRRGGRPAGGARPARPVANGEPDRRARERIAEPR
jgi:uncharacterized protein involved in exopolysaccharide biosynthesis